MTAALSLVSTPAQNAPLPRARGLHDSGIAPRFNPGPSEQALANVGLDLSRFACRVTSATARDERAQDSLRTAYKCWSEAQRALLKEVGRDPGIPSDEFSRQDEWVSIMYGDECVAVAAFRWLDMNLSYYEEDSYFRVWPEEARRTIMAIGRKVCIVSNVAVARAWRGRFGSFSVKELIVGLCIQHFNESDADVIVATMRNMRGMNRVTYHFGAKPVITGLVHPTYGEEIDLITVEKRPEDERFPQDLNGDLTRIIWRNQEEEEI